MILDRSRESRNCGGAGSSPGDCVEESGSVLRDCGGSSSSSEECGGGCNVLGGLSASSGLGVVGVVVSAGA